MDLTNIPKSTPIEPYIECDGWYCVCQRCWHEIESSDNICPKCGQTQDWSWFGRYTKNK